MNFFWLESEAGKPHGCGLFLAREYRNIFIKKDLPRKSI